MSHTPTLNPHHPASQQQQSPSASTPTAATHAMSMDAAAAQAYIQQQIAAGLQQLQQQQLPLPAAAPGGAGPRAAEPRIPSPSTFDGRAATLDGWLSELSRQFGWYRLDSPARDAERIRLAAVHFNGAAWDWWETLAAKPADWAAFVTALRTRFQPVTSAELARAQMLSLSQGKSSVHDYVASFRRLAVALPQMHEDDRLFQFMRGLRPAIAMQLRVHGDTVKTMDAAIAMATRIGSLGELGASHASIAAAAHSSSSHHAPMELDAIEGLERDTADGADGSAPVTRAQLMELLNAVRDERRSGGGSGAGASGSSSGGSRRSFQPRGLPTIPGLSEAQVKEYMDAGKCFGCGSKDHRSRQCPKRKVGADGHVSWGK